MSDLKISFSHQYPKLHNQKSARLIYIEVHDRSEMNDRLIEYDTVYEDESGKGYYPLHPGKYMVLVFLGDYLIPFTTIRRWTREKQRYYNGKIGQVFIVNIL